MKYLSAHFLGSQRNGVNHVSMNLGDFDRLNGPTRGTDYPQYSNALLDWYQTSKMTSARVLFTWEAVQSALLGPVPPAAGAGYADYWADLLDVVGRLLARGIYVALSPWQYNTASGDTDMVYDDAAFTAAQFGDFWGKFAAAINAATGNDQRVAFDLINEPHASNGAPDIGIATSAWFACAQAAITAIRGKGATNTILVPGMNYGDPASFVINSAAGWLTLNDPQKNIAVTVHQYGGVGSVAANILRVTCSQVVTWARAHNLKVHIGEIAIDAGSPTGSLAAAQAQWAEWNRFCVENSDVIVGWNWWANSEADWWSTLDSTSGRNWGLTLDDGVTPTVYMNLIASTIPAPRLVIHDNAGDTTAEPNATTAVGWESADITVTQAGGAGGVILGGTPSVVHVQITNVGAAPYSPSYGHVVRLYWAKAGAGLGWPEPWNGLVGGVVPPPPKRGEPFAPAAVPALVPGQTQTIDIGWADTPDPAAYPVQDGHFCLLAFAVPPNAPEFDGFDSPDLNVDVLKFSHVAWRNIHVTAVGADKMGSLVVANQTQRRMRTQVSFHVLDENGRMLDRHAGVLLITPSRAALDRMRRSRVELACFEDIGLETFRVLDTETGIPHIHLEPGESVAIGVSHAHACKRESRGYAIRAIQWADEGGVRSVVGGQTFVAGVVRGLNPPVLRRYAG